MYLIKEITDKSLGIKSPSGVTHYYIRKAARAIVIDEKGRIPLLYSKKHNYYKLPGGGIDEGEDTITGLKREILEEVGAESKIQNELGLTIEIKDQEQQIQFSYIYIGFITKPIGIPTFTQQEIIDGLELHWFHKEDVLEKLQSSAPDDYVGNFIVARDIAIFEYFLQS